ncbi:phage integrase N-terminal SAM-like domain-containing protein [bacterium]|nr:phage integrase N-terminal SAM-like domain-containing protein [bacterium]
MNEPQRLKQLQHRSTNPTIEGVPQIDALEQMQLRMLGDMQLQGLAERTQESYVRAIRKLAEHYGKGPDQISDEELREYFLYRMNVQKWSRVTSTIAICGIKFFYDQTIKERWPEIRFVRARHDKKIPVMSDTGIFGTHLAQNDGRLYASYRDFRATGAENHR